jgi:quercetin dioxygenase-like cupin family protein
MMIPRSAHAIVQELSGHHSRRATVRRLIVGGGAAVLASRSLDPVAAQEPAGECVATAPPAEEGIGFAPLLVGGIIQDMPTGPVDVHISRFTLEPGAEVPMAPQPYAQLVYVETGGMTCPDNPGKLMYGPDGTVMYETTGGDEWHTCTPGMTWHVPAGIEDAAINEGSELMSALVLEFAPVEDTATPTT